MNNLPRVKGKIILYGWFPKTCNYQFKKKNFRQFLSHNTLIMNNELEKGHNFGAHIYERE